MSATTDQSIAAMDALLEQATMHARRNGRLELANEILQWWVSRREELPQHLREEFAQLILKAVD